MRMVIREYREILFEACDDKSFQVSIGEADVMANLRGGIICDNEDQ